MSDLYIEARLQAIKDIASASCQDEKDVANISSFCDEIHEKITETRNKAIDDFSNALADDLTLVKRFGDEVYNDVGIDVRIRAEQLKAGGENDD